MSARDRGLPLGLLGMLVLVAAGESLSERLGREVMTTAAANYHLAGRSARLDAPRCEILCFGDSLMKFGLVPRMIEEATGLRTFNLGMIGGQPPASHAALSHALESGARPRAILVDFKASILTVGSQFNRSNLPELLSLGECVTLARKSEDSRFLADLVLGWVSPSYRRRLEVRKGLHAALAGQVPEVRGELWPLRRNWRVNRGALLLNQVPGLPPPEPGPADAPVYFPEVWSLDRTNVTYVRRFLELARARGIPVFWVIPPIRPDMQARREALGLEARYDEFVRRAASRFPNVTVIDARRAGYAAGLFVDLSHLEARGAALFSADVGAAVAARLGQRPRLIGRASDGPRNDPSVGIDARWVMLPSFRDRPIDGPLEDIAGSRLALGIEEPYGSRSR